MGAGRVIATLVIGATTAAAYVLAALAIRLVQDMACALSVTAPALAMKDLEASFAVRITTLREISSDLLCRCVMSIRSCRSTKHHMGRFRHHLSGRDHYLPWILRSSQISPRRSNRLQFCFESGCSFSPVCAIRAASRQFRWIAHSCWPYVL